MKGDDNTPPQTAPLTDGLILELLRRGVLDCSLVEMVGTIFMTCTQMKAAAMIPAVLRWAFRARGEEHE